MPATVHVTLVPGRRLKGEGAINGRDALEGKGPQRRPQKRLDRRLEEGTKAAGGGYCRFQMRLKLALGVRETVAGRPGGGYLPPFQCMHTWGHASEGPARSCARPVTVGVVAPTPAVPFLRPIPPRSRHGTCLLIPCAKGIWE